MELFVYKGQSELPSIDFDCLRAIVINFLKIFDFHS